MAKKLPELVTPEMLAEAILKNDRVRLSLGTAIKSSETPDNLVDEATANQIARAMEGNQDVS